jgi:creatinine amidohydrolase
VGQSEQSESALDVQATTYHLRDVAPKMAIVPLAALEQHGPHLPVATDWLVIEHIARRVAEALPGSLLLPTLPFGTSLAHAGTAGTVGLAWPTLLHVISDVVRSLMAQGIQRVAVINNLGEVAGTTVQPRGNFIAKTAVRQLNYAHPQLQTLWLQPLTVAAAELRTVFESWNEDVHAGEVETSLVLALRPDLVKGRGTDYIPAVGRQYLDWASFAQLAPGGIWGRPSQASAEKGQRALDAAVRASVAYVQESFAFLEQARHGAVVAS